MPKECYQEIFVLADREELSQGKAWYDVARQRALTLAEETGKSLETCAGVIAVLSPMVEWNVNIKAASAILKHGSKARRVPGFRLNRRKALAVLRGEYESIKGPKVREFWLTILNPSHTEPVIDSQMIGAWYNGEIDKGDIGKVAGNKKKLEEIRQAVKDIAREEELKVAQVQAIIWLTFKRLKGPYANQLKLWR
jgi:hypothetical protein